METVSHTTRLTARPATRFAARRRGSSLILATASLFVMIGFTSFAVDVGRVQLAKAELRRAADAAARVGATSLATTVAQARYDAREWSKRNLVDGRKLADAGITVEVGLWNQSSRSFRLPTSNSDKVNAVRVVLTRPATGPESVPLLWASLVGVKGMNVSAEAIAEYIPGEYVEHQVDGTANPFLAGMPKGAVASLNNPHNSPDYAGDATSSNPAKRRQSPPVVPLTVRPGDVLEFNETITGTVRHDPNLPFFNPDGELTDIGRNTNGSENGIADTTAPINALVGVFLSDARPDATATPSSDRSFGTDSGRDFSKLQPQLKQTFFIGDGANGAGMKQKFVVPAGATRLYLATWDFFEWNNNAGARIVKIQRPGRIVTVK